MPRRARALVEELVAHGRTAGTPEARAARRSVSDFLTQLGYEVQEYPFGFNAGVYRALPAAGALLAMGALAEIPLLQRGAPAWAAAAWLLLIVVVAGSVVSTLVRSDGSPGHRRTDANLVACRPGAAIRCWLVAHLDTKAQVQSMAGRLVAVWVAVPVVFLLIACSIVRLRGPLPLCLAGPLGAAGCLAGLLVARGRLSGESPGARDNGSGLLAVLAAAELAVDASVGVIITGAEEFGLAGAKALAQERAALLAGTMLINVDTVDDHGTLYVVSHGSGGADLAARLLDRLAGLAPECRERRLPLGIMVDGVPLSRVAAQAVTIGRLGWGTLRRMHTPRDDAEGYSLATAESLGERLAMPFDRSASGR